MTRIRLIPLKTKRESPKNMVEWQTPCRNCPKQQSQSRNKIDRPPLKGQASKTKKPTDDDPPSLIDIVKDSPRVVKETFAPDRYRYSLLKETHDNKNFDDTVESRSLHDYHKRCVTCLPGTDEKHTMGDVDGHDKPKVRVKITFHSTGNLSHYRIYSES